MNVLALTIFVGLLLAGFFAILWIASTFDARQFNERDALLPLEQDALLTLEQNSQLPLERDALLPLERETHLCRKTDL